MRYPNIIILILIMTGGLVAPSFTSASEPISRTETVCTIGMLEGDTGRTCDVPIPDNCTVANYPGYDEPWAEVDKGGRISCTFDDKKTDWKTKITGTCGKCITKQCTARFSVKFNCTENVPPASPHNPRIR
ncbi:MAG: hypothetical protein O7F12_01680 [Nitrospirae bacterium]|nr:hypothetical protein [Nitrospirota bacterium]